MTAQITRCDHDMLVIDGKTTCADCLRLPDVPLIDDLTDRPARKHLTPNPLDERWHRDTARTVEKCSSCGREITDYTVAAWSPDDAGLVGACCAD